MPLNDIIAGVEDRPDHSEYELPSGEEANMPADTPVETSMRTNHRMLPPYLHVQNVSENSFTLLAMVGTVLSLSRYLDGLQ